MKCIFLIILLFLPGCNTLWWRTDMSRYDIEFYGRLVDSDKRFHPELSRNDRIYLKYIKDHPVRINNNDSGLRYTYNLN